MSADADLTLLILRDIQQKLVVFDARLEKLEDLPARVASIEEKLDVTNERLSLVERATTFMAAQINVMRRQMGIEERTTDDEIRDLQARVTKLEEVVKP